MPLILSIIGIALFCYILLLCPVVITADLNREPEFFLKFLFFKFRLYPRVKKEKKSKKQKGQKNKAETERKKQNKSKPKGISYYIDKYGDIIKSVISAAKKLLAHISIGRLDVSVTVGGEDAATVAVEYGAVCAVVYPICSMIESNVDVKESSISIKPDFDAKTSSGTLYVDVRIKAFHVLATVFGLTYRLIKFLSK